MEQGRIVKLAYDRGFGFILVSSHAHLFFHRSAVEGMDFDALREGQTVECDEHWDSNRRRFYAAQVRLVATPSVATSPTSAGR